MKKLILIQLNELNFDVLNKYLEIKNFPNLKKIVNLQSVVLTSEKEYHQLEPWVQWVSVYTGKSFDEHKIFRLGDAENIMQPQIYETIERLGFSVIAVSPMNAANRLTNSKLFMPDPWTETKFSGGWLDQKLYKSIKQLVNDNAGSKVELKSAFYFILAFIVYSKKINWILYLKLVMSSRWRKWNKALFLDLFLCDYFVKKSEKTNADFSSLFLNSIAHIQHHYLKNSIVNSSTTKKNPSWLLKKNQDPMLDGLSILDKALEPIVNDLQKNLVVATGLSQELYKPFEYYYRLKNHKSFLKKIGVDYLKVLPRMTRDFEVIFSNNILRDKAHDILSDVKSGNMCLFGVIEKRNKSLFITFSFNDEIVETTKVSSPIGEFYLRPYVNFVALKNGHHIGKSWAYFSDGLASKVPKNGSHVKELQKTFTGYFS